MRRLILPALIILALPMSTTKDYPAVRVIDKKGIAHEGEYLRTWDGVNIVYNKKWKEVYRMNKY